MTNKVGIETDASLERDIRSGAVLNKNTDALEKHQASRQRIKILEQDIQELKTGMSQILMLLQELKGK